MSAVSRVTLVVLAVIAASGLGLASAPEASAHAAFVGATPAPGVRVEVPPQEVALRFTEPLNERLTSVKLVSIASGRRVAAALRVTGRGSVAIEPGPLARGAYRVEWHTVSTEDGHALEGRFSFGIRAAAIGGQHTIEQSPFARGGWLRVVLRVLLYGTGLLFVAALVLPHLVRGGASWLTPETLGAGALVTGRRRRQRALTDGMGWIAATAAVAVTLAEAADAARSLAPHALSDFLLANIAGGARLGVIVFLVAAAALWHRLPRIAATLGVLALGAIAASGHASSASPRMPSVLNDWLHLTSAAVWLGGIALLALIWAWPLRHQDAVVRRQVARHVLVPFGRVALPAFAAVATTGVVSLLTQLGHISALWQTDYGRVLAAKIVLVGAIALASAVHAWRLRPRVLEPTEYRDGARAERRHWRLVRLEPALGLGVLAVVALLVAFPLPPRQLGDADDARAATSACDPCPLPKPAADELPVATRAGSHLVAAWIRRTPTTVSGTVRVRDVRGRATRIALRIANTIQSSCGPGCWRFRGPPSADRLRVSLRERGKTHVGVLPVRWRRHQNERARALLASAERVMRRLRSVRETEEVTSGPGSYARTDYRLQAPDRMAFRTGGGIETVVAGKRQWFRTGPGPWKAGEYGAGLAFRTRSWFRWSIYGRHVRLLSETTRGRRVAELALFDEGTPVWFRVRIDLPTHRVLEEQMTAKGHFMDTRYLRFNEPLTISIPERSVGP